MTKESQTPKTARFTITTDDNAPRFCAGDVVFVAMTQPDQIKPGDYIQDGGRIVKAAMIPDKPAYKVFQTVTDEASPARVRMFQNYARSAGSGQE